MYDAPQVEMPKEYLDILQNISKSTTNDIIIFSIIILIGLCILLIPVLLVVNKYRKDNQKAQTDEKKLMIDVVDRNTNAFAILKTSIEKNNEMIAMSLRNIESESTNTHDTLIHMMRQGGNTDDKIERIDNLVNTMSQDLKTHMVESDILHDIDQKTNKMYNDIDVMKDQIEKIAMGKT